MKNFIRKRIREEISASEAYNDINSIQTLIDKKRKVAFIGVANKQMLTTIKNNGLFSIAIPREDGPTAYIVYVKGAEVEAKELLKIANKYGGYLSYMASDVEQRIIGQLLGYKRSDVEEYIARNKTKKVSEQMIDGQDMNKGTQTICKKMTINSYAEALGYVKQALNGLSGDDRHKVIDQIRVPMANLKKEQGKIDGEVKNAGMSGDSMPDESDTYWSEIQTAFCELGGDGLTEETEKPLFNDNFKTWFNGSSVVDSSSNPLVCYHGTNTEIKNFNPKFSAQGVFWFTTDKDKILSGNSGAQASSNIIPVFISASKIAGWSEYEKLGLGQIEDMGYHAIKLDDDFIVFDPHRIKSINNKGGWSMKSKNIFA